MEYEIKIEWECDITTISLSDYGHEETTKWEDLTEQEKNEITDSLVDEAKHNFKIIVTKED